MRALPLGIAAERSVHYFWDYFGPSVLRAPAEQTKVATVLGTFFHFLSCYHRYSKPQKGLSYCFKFLHGPLKKNNKNLGKKKFDPAPPPLAPWGRFLGFFKCFFENFEGYSADMCGGNFR